MPDSIQPLSLDALRADDRFKALTRGGNGFDMAEALGFAGKELSYSRLIAYLLDSRAGHRLAHPLFAALARRAGHMLTAAGPIRSQTEVEHIDIYIDSPDLLLGIENKIHAPEGHKQLATYQTRMAGRAGGRPAALFFLTPSGRSSRTARPESETGVPVYRLSYGDLGDMLAEAVSSLDPPGDDTRFAALCATHFKEQVMHQGDQRDTARQIWADEAAARGVNELLRHRPRVSGIARAYIERARRLVAEMFDGSDAVIQVQPKNGRADLIAVSVQAWRDHNLFFNTVLHDQFQEPVFPEIQTMIFSGTFTKYRATFEALASDQAANTCPGSPRISFERIPGWAEFYSVWEGQNASRARRVTDVITDEAMVEQAIEHLRAELTALTDVLQPYLNGTRADDYGESPG